MGRVTAVTRREFDDEVANGEDRSRRHRRCLGSNRSRSRSPTRLKASTATKMARPGKVGHPPLVEDHRSALGHHQAPVGRPAATRPDR